MTSAPAIIISVILMINDLSLQSNSEVDVLFSADHWPANLVYLCSSCLLIRKLSFFPLKKKFHRISCFLEIPIVLLLLECSIIYIWLGLQLCINAHAHDIVEFLINCCHSHTSWLGYEPDQKEECVKDFSIVDEQYITCSSPKCGNTWHLDCANSTHFKAEGQAAWICPVCQARSRMGGDNTNTPLLPNENVTLRKKANNEQRDSAMILQAFEALTVEVRQMRQEMAHMRSEFCGRFDTLAEKLHDYDERIVKLEEKDKENSLLKVQVAELEAKLNQQAQQSLNSELEIVGVPETPNENPYHIVLTTASKLGLELSELDMNHVTRAGPRRNPEKKEDQSRPIVVSFVRRVKREEFLKHARSRRSALNSKDIVPTAPEKTLYVNERLTSNSRRLFRDARVWAKEHGFKYCWTRGGNIYVRKNEGRDGSPALQIRAHDDLQKLSGERDHQAENRIERTASKRWRGSMRRIVSAAIFNLSCFTHGCSTGWVSGVLGREALAGGAWLAALPCLVALPTAPFFAFLADAKGRKAGAVCICVSFIISWSLAAWCGPRGVWASRVAAGAGGAGALALAPLYCAEISPRTKGLAAMPALAISCGILFAFIAGGILSAHALSLSMAAPPTVLLVSLVWLPETPSFLISVGRMQEAARVMCWLNGSDSREDLTDAIEQQEVMIRTEPRRGSDALQPMLRGSEGASEATSQGTQRSQCHELFRHRRSRRALISCCLLLAAAAGSGAGAVNSFAAAVLTHSGHALPTLNLTAYNFTVYNGTLSRGWRQTSETGSVLCGTALVLGAAVATVTVDRLGRKVLLLISCIGIAFCLTFLGFYCDPHVHMYSWYPHRLWPYKKPSALKEKHINFTIESISKDVLSDLSDSKIKAGFSNDSVAELNVKPVKEVNGTIKGGPSVEIGQNTMERHADSIWPPVILLSMVVFLYNIGLGSVPYVLISELFSIHVRSLASSLLISWMWLTSFLTLRYFSTLALIVGLHGTYYIGASVTLLVSGYIFFMLPETRGKNQKQIDDLLNGPLLVHLKRKRKTNET